MAHGNYSIITIYIAGIGGCILDRDQNLIFIFSGPSQATSPREAEREAILFAFKSFTSRRSIQGRLQIKMNCISLVHDFQKYRAGYTNPDDHADWIRLINNPGIKVCYSPRDNLIAAHDLATQGTNRKGYFTCLVLIINLLRAVFFTNIATNFLLSVRFITRRKILARNLL